MADHEVNDHALDHAPGVGGWIRTEPTAFDRDVTVEGRLPTCLRGSYYAIGPARFTVGDVRYRYWLDGDGFVLAAHFGGEGDHARVVGRFVDGAKQTEEAAAGRAIYRTFGTAFEGDQLRKGLGLASPTNVSVHPWRGDLLAYGEQALPYRLDPRSLETRGEHDFGRLSAASPLSAHPAIDPDTGELFNFGIGFSPARPTLTFYCIDADGEIRVRKRHAIDLPVSVHDFAVSERYAIFDLAPYVLDFAAFRAGASLFESLDWKPELGRRLLVLDRDTGDEVARIDMPTGYCLHLIDAWQSDETLVVDMLELESPIYDQYRLDAFFVAPRRSEAVRYEIDVSGGAIRSRTALAERALCDFPIVDRRDHSFFASAISKSEQPGRTFIDRVVRCAWPDDRTTGDRPRGVVDAWQAPEGVYLAGEVGFAPDDTGATRGALVVPVATPSRGESQIFVFDAGDLAAGPVATLALPTLVPPLFHACFAAAASD